LHNQGGVEGGEYGLDHLTFPHLPLHLFLIRRRQPLSPNFFLAPSLPFISSFKDSVSGVVPAPFFPLDL
jgi:hypothetical protein